MKSKTFLIADTHFGHKNVIKYENRPFSNVAEMDGTLITNWNSTVDMNDTVFMLGDFSFYNKTKTIEICRQLNGKKILVMGNHDNESYRFYLDCGFDEVSRYPILYQNFWILSHEPIYINENMPYANIYGHIHNNPSYNNYSSQSFCVSVERINYTPIDFEEIKSNIYQKNE